MNKFLSLVSFLFVLLLSFSSCDTTVREAVDERKSKDHGDPISVRLTLTPGRLVNQVFTPLIDPKVEQTNSQTIEYMTQKNIGWAPIPSRKSGFDVFLSSEDTTLVYRLDIKYFDLLHKDITYQFVENGQDKIHQHFFTVESLYTQQGKVRTTEKTNLILSYTYGDTDPWSQEMGTNGVRWIGKDNPIGFKGYFRFLKAQKFDLNIRLMHARVSKYNRHNHALSPFYAPAPGQIQENAWDLSMRFPITVIRQ